MERKTKEEKREEEWNGEKTEDEGEERRGEVRGRGREYRRTGEVSTVLFHEQLAY